MCLLRVLQRICARSRAAIHAARLTLVLDLITALVHGHGVSLSALGRALGGPTDPKHRIKRVDRALSNPHLHRERPLLFAGLAAELLKQSPHPVIIVDWTPNNEKFSTLAAAVPFQGRALPIYTETHPVARQNTPQVEARFLDQLATILPVGCTPLLVADAGFRGPFCQAVQAHGWDFLVRIRSTCLVHLEGAPAPVLHRDFYAQATSRPKALGWGAFALRGARTTARFALARAPKKTTAAPTKRGRRKASAATGRSPRNRPRNGAQAKARKAAIEPWLLATSLPHASARLLVSLYASRMQIEEMFRDTKNHRFGWSLEDARYHHAARLDVLFLLIALAMYAVTLLGVAAESIQRHRAYQGNTIRDRRVISWFVLGTWLLQHNDTDWLDAATLDCALTRYQAMHVCLAELPSG